MATITQGASNGAGGVHTYNMVTGKKLRPGEQYDSKTGKTITSKSTTETNEYNSVTGKKLKRGESYVDAKGRTVKQGTPLGTYTETKKDTAAKTTATSAPDFTSVSAMIDGLKGVDQGQKDILKLYAKANFTKNPELANQIMAALETSTRFSTPQFKQQADMLKDALKLNFSAREGDLAFREQQQRESLKKLEADYAATSAYNTFEENQKLKQLMDKYKQDLEVTQENLAATGFTSSSKRSRAEQLLSEQNQGLVESTTKSYGYQRGQNDRTIAYQRSDVAAQIENLRRLAAEGKLGDLRTTESKLGSGALGEYANLPNLVSGFDNVLGGQVGSQNYDLTKTITSGASNFIF